MKNTYIIVCALVIGCFQAHAAAPANALFSGREYIELAHGPAVLDGVVTHATTEPFEPGSGFKSLWWEVVAPSDGILRIQTTSSLDHNLSAWVGTQLVGLKSISSTANGTSRALNVIMASGTRIVIRAAARYATSTGSITLAINFDNQTSVSFVPITGVTSHDNNTIGTHQVLEGFQASGSSFISNAGTEPFESGVDTL